MLREFQVGVQRQICSPSPGEGTAFSCTQELFGNDLELPVMGKGREELFTLILSKVTGLQLAMILFWGIIPLLIVQI